MRLEEMAREVTESASQEIKHEIEGIIQGINEFEERLYNDIVDSFRMYS